MADVKENKLEGYIFSALFNLIVVIINLNTLLTGKYKDLFIIFVCIATVILFTWLASMRIAKIILFILSELKER